MRYLLTISLLIMGVLMACGQSVDDDLQDKNLIELRRLVQQTPKIPSLRLTYFHLGSAFSNSTGSPSAKVAAFRHTPSLPAAWRYEDLALFCKLEVKMEKALHMPVKFRLGEVQYVERMEGKLQTGVSQQRQ